MTDAQRAQYSQQWNQTAAQVAPQPPPSGYADDFSDPATRGISPRWEQLDGRLLMIRPTKLERGVVNTLGRPDSNGQMPTQDRMTCTVTILDGPPLLYGGKPKEGIPDTIQANVPCEFEGMLNSQVLIVSQCESKVPGAPGGKPEGGVVLGRYGRSEKAPSQPGMERARKLLIAADADRALARQWVAYKANASIGNPADVAQAPAPAPQVSQAPPQSYGVPPAPVQSYDPQMAAQAYLGGPPQANYAPQPQPPQTYAQGGPIAPPLDISTPPTGMPPEVWETLTTEQKTAFAQSAAARPGW
jgi:hypothetical protein